MIVGFDYTVPIGQVPRHNRPMNREAILVHGWDPRYYNLKMRGQRTEGMAWSHRPELVRLLSERFRLRYYNLPGFAGNSEPAADFYDVEDFARDFAQWKGQECPHPDLIIGYSFGGAVALAHKVLRQDRTPTVLISPAIFRGEGLQSEIAHRSKNLIPQRWMDLFKHWYLLTASQYYREGTQFLRQTYNVIVRRDLRPLLNRVDPNGILLIYGENDRDTPWSLVRDTVVQRQLTHHVIASGAHNIGQTSPDEIVGYVDDFLQGR